ncbi:Thymidylate kinase [Slackia heliotrinireducens]|uniref:Thymidylate kinase n=1 Tax=Slackia heliotrinireducens (strain ATCC 29202 / DSM 20476 / NCTC 11029 / RHS 1) TaxID=471855 RepID=C7N6V3_SLAHD|nr:dTMP kinase [Slackia heliotrinireducens]ACV22638.1 thymidylate kinase [Slackia heliotrinireducens DSM 20476]VEH01184.1 Thymidylate kinase [Slackia heliotrinireducens]
MTDAAAHTGVFITFEGGEGAGKSTHINFLAQTLEACGFEVVRVREPGSTRIGEQLRGVVLDPENAEMADWTELFIYEAARAQLVAEAIKPALERGAIVLCDRFTDSTLAYQGYGRGLELDRVRRANELACQGIVPDATVLMVAPNALEGLYRATKDDGADRLESAGHDFHVRVNQAFVELAAQSKKRIRMVQSASAKSLTSQSVFKALADVLPQLERFIGNEDHFASLDVKKVD